MNASVATNAARASDDGYAIEFLHDHMLGHASLSPLGLRWLSRAMRHLETRLDRFMRGRDGEGVGVYSGQGDEA